MEVYSKDELMVGGEYAKYISIACIQFENKLDADWKKYKVLVSENDKTVQVVFNAKETPQGLRGSVEGVPGFEVNIQKQDFEIIDYQFVK